MRLLNIPTTATSSGMKCEYRQTPIDPHTPILTHYVQSYLYAIYNCIFPHIHQNV
jgi:hypothetical protein